MGCEPVKIVPVLVNRLLVIETVEYLVQMLTFSDFRGKRNFLYVIIEFFDQEGFSVVLRTLASGSAHNIFFSTGGKVVEIRINI